MQVEWLLWNIWPRPAPGVKSGRRRRMGDWFSPSYSRFGSSPESACGFGADSRADNGSKVATTPVRLPDRRIVSVRRETCLLGLPVVFIFIGL